MNARLLPLQLMFRYPEDEELARIMSKLAREELRHFEQVQRIMQQKGIADRKQSAARYASELRSHVRNCEPGRLVDILITGAFIEARSCERFAALAPLLDDELAKFYTGLLESEGRHYQQYIRLAKQRWLINPPEESQKKNQNRNSDASGQQDLEADFEQRVNWFRAVEQALIERADKDFRFHSGVPCNSL